VFHYVQEQKNYDTGLCLSPSKAKKLFCAGQNVHV
jgi:hypothetical protein